MCLDVFKTPFETFSIRDIISDCSFLILLISLVNIVLLDSISCFSSVVILSRNSPSTYFETSCINSTISRFNSGNTCSCI